MIRQRVFAFNLNKQGFVPPMSRMAFKSRRELEDLRAVLVGKIASFDRVGVTFSLDIYDDSVKMLRDVEEALVAKTFDPLENEWCLEEQNKSDPECKTFDV